MIGSIARTVFALLVAAVLMSGATVAQDERTDGRAPDEGEGRRLAIVIGETEAGHIQGLLEAGARQAAADLGVRLEPHVTRTRLAHQAALIERIVASGPDGLAIAVADAAGLRDAIEGAVEVGIPVVLAHTGASVWREVGAQAFVGPDHVLAGEMAGKRLGALGMTRVICVKDEVTEEVLHERCRGAQQGLERSGGVLDLLLALDPPGDPTGVRDAIEARLYLDPGIDGVLAAEQDAAAAALQAIRRSGLGDRVRIAAFDPDVATLRAIQTGEVLLAIDQQPFLQGYLSILFLSSQPDHGPRVGVGQPVLIRPRFIDRQNVGEVLDMALQARR